jgi:hypothetical protein
MTADLVDPDFLVRLASRTNAAAVAALISEALHGDVQASIVPDPIQDVQASTVPDPVQHAPSDALVTICPASWEGQPVPERRWHVDQWMPQ